jgi:hypothetical protein
MTARHGSHKERGRKGKTSSEMGVLLVRYLHKGLKIDIVMEGNRPFPQSMPSAETKKHSVRKVIMV